MVEVFKTDVEKEYEAEGILKKLSEHYPECRINFDLDDCDNILRVEGRKLNPQTIISCLNNLSYKCIILE
jgi:hypothetical protein